MKRYKAEGKRVVAYLSAGSYESGRPDSAHFDKACYEGAKMDGWPEFWLNTGSSACLRNIHAVMTKRIQLAKQKGFDAIDPVGVNGVAWLIEQDNIDASENETGWPISSKQSIAYLKWLAKTAHDHGLGCGLKNGGAYLKRDSSLVSRFDFVRRSHRRLTDHSERH